MNLLRYLIFSFTLLASFRMLAQQPAIRFEYDIAGFITPDFESVADRLFIRVINDSGVEQHINILASLRGRDGEAAPLIIHNRDVEPTRIIVPISGLNMTLRQLIEQYQETEIESYYIAPAALRDQLIQERRLPGGNFQLCLEARDFFTGTLLSLPAGTDQSTCHVFEVTYLRSPEIQSPQHGAWITANDNNELMVHWTMADFRSNIRYILEVVRIPSQALADLFNDQGRPDDVFESFERVLFAEDIATLNYSSLQSDTPVDIQPGDRLAVRVTAYSDDENIFIRNRGRSQINIFFYGTPVGTECNNPAFLPELVFPTPGDTLPFVKPYFLVKIDPDCPNIKEISYNSRITARYNGSSVFSGEYAYTNDFRSAGSPSAWLRNFLQDEHGGSHTHYYPPGSDRHQHALLCPSFGSGIQRGADTRMSALANITYENLNYGTESTTTLNFNDAITNGIIVGMPRPLLAQPEEDQTFAPGTINFRFSTGTAPTNLLPPYKAYVMATGSNAAVQELRTYEKCVIQVSRTNNFSLDNIVASRLFKIQGNPMDDRDRFDINNPNMQPFSPSHDTRSELSIDVNAYMDQIYRDLDVSFPISTNGRYYWRVIWLKNPDAVNVLEPHRNGINIGIDDIYHASSIREFVIDPSGTVGGSDPDAGGYICGNDDEEDENEAAEALADCERGTTYPNPGGEPHSVLRVGSMITVGGYQVRVTEVNSNVTRHTGRGVLTIPVSGSSNSPKIQVTFDNIQVNISGALIGGEIRGATSPTSPRRLPRSNSDEIRTVISAIDNLSRFADAFSDGGSILPLGLDVREGTNLRIACALDGLRLTPTNATADYIFGVKLPEEIGVPAIMFQGENVNFHPEGGFPIGRYSLAEDFNITADRGWRFGISGGSNPTYVEFDCAGLKEFAFRGNVTFSRDALIPENETTGLHLTDEDDNPSNDPQVRATFGTIIINNRPGRPASSAPPSGSDSREVRSENFIIDLTFDRPFQIAGLDGVGFTVTTAVLDLSEVSNHADMDFPDDYDMALYGTRASLSGFSGDRLENAWTGFFLNELSIRLPKDIDEARQGFGIHNLLVDASGVSVTARVTAGFGEARNSELGFKISLNNFEAGIVQSQSVFFRLNGKIGLPIFKDQESDYLNYSAGLEFGPPSDDEEDGDEPSSGPSGPGSGTSANLVFRISVPDRPDGLDIPMWDIAKINLDRSTNVELKIGTNTEFSFGITGTVSFLSSNNESGASQDITLNMPRLKLENLRFSTKRSGIQGDINLVMGTGSSSRTRNLWSSTASPDSDDEDDEDEDDESADSSEASNSNDAAGFPINLRGIELAMHPGSAPDAMEYDIRFDLEISFSNQISAGGNLGFHFKLGDRGRFNQFTVMSFLPPNRIDIEAKNMGGLEIEGQINFCNSATQERFIGALRVKVPSLCEIKLYADFGTIMTDRSRGFNSPGYYSFFSIEGSVRLETGITIFSGVALYGLGGGVFYNMSRNAPPARVTLPPPTGERRTAERNVPASDLPEPTAIACGSGPYRPLHNSIGFMFQAFLGDNGGGSAYNLDVSLSATFEVRDGAVVGVQQVEFDGNLYVACDIGTGNESGGAPIRANVKITLTRQPDGDGYYEGVHGTIAVYLNLAPIIEGSGPGGKLVDAVFHADNRNMWYFYLGAPRGQTGQYAVDGRRSSLANYPGPAGITALGMDLESYFMIGKSIPDLPPIDTEIEQIMNKGRGFDESLSNSTANALRTRPTDMESGDGFAHGLKFRMDNTFNFLLFYAHLKVILGYDINFRQYPGRQCLDVTTGATTPLGINGWYAKGQAYAGLEGSFGIGVKFGEVKVGIEICKLGCAIAIQAEFPNPNWFKGRASMYYDILNGTYTGQAYFVMEIGQKCYDPNYTPLDGMEFISEILPEGNGVSTGVKPSVSFVLPMDRELALIDEQATDAAGENGDPVYRYFTPRFTNLEIIPPAGTLAADMPTFRPEVDYFENNKVARRYITNQLQPHTTYRIRATVEADERVEYGYRRLQVRGANWQNTLETTFRTGAAMQTLDPEHIISTYPFKNQRNFMVGERGDRGVASGGWIDMGQGQDCLEPAGRVTTGEGLLSSTTEISYYLELAPSDNSNPSAETRRLPVNLVGKTAITFNIPSDLTRNQIFRARLVKVKRYSGLNSSITDIFVRRIRRSAEARAGEGEITATMNSNTISLASIANREDADAKVLYEFYFRTSRYNTLDEKIASFTQRPTTVVWNIPIINYTSNEPFDSYDVNGYRSAMRGIWLFPPLIKLYEPYSGPGLSNIAHNIYRFADALPNTLWLHTYTGDPVNTGCIPHLNAELHTYFRTPYIGPEVSWTRPINGTTIAENQLQARYRIQNKTWTDPTFLPQEIRVSSVPLLSGSELIYTRRSAMEDALADLTGPRISLPPSSGIGYHFGTSGSSGSSSTTQDVSIGLFHIVDWNVNRTKVTTAVNAIFNRHNNMINAYNNWRTSVRGVPPPRASVNYNHWLRKQNPSGTIDLARLNNVRWMAHSNYQHNSDYNLQLSFARPKTTVRRIPDIRWRIVSSSGSSESWGDDIR